MKTDTELTTIEGWMEALATMGDAAAKDLLASDRSEYPWKPYDAAEWGPKGRLKECFRNAWTWAGKWADLTYCEGYADSGTGFPVHHAWLIDLDGNVVDPTWREPTDEGCGYCLGDGRFDGETCWACEGTGEAPSNPEWREGRYVGIALPLERVTEILLTSGTYCVLGKPR